MGLRTWVAAVLHLYEWPGWAKAQRLHEEFRGQAAAAGGGDQFDAQESGLYAGYSAGFSGGRGGRVDEEVLGVYIGHRPLEDNVYRRRRPAENGWPSRTAKPVSG